MRQPSQCDSSKKEPQSQKEPAWMIVSFVSAAANIVLFLAFVVAWRRKKLKIVQPSDTVSQISPSNSRQIPGLEMSSFPTASQPRNNFQGHLYEDVGMPEGNSLAVKAEGESSMDGGETGQDAYDHLKHGEQDAACASSSGEALYAHMKRDRKGKEACGSHPEETPYDHLATAGAISSVEITQKSVKTTEECEKQTVKEKPKYAQVDLSKKNRLLKIHIDADGEHTREQQE